MLQKSVQSLKVLIGELKNDRVETRSKGTGTGYKKSITTLEAELKKLDKKIKA